MFECSTLSMHISRHILDDGATLLRIGSSMFRLYQDTGTAQLHISGQEYRTLPAADAADIFRLMGMAEAVAGRWRAQ